MSYMATTPAPAADREAALAGGNLFAAAIEGVAQPDADTNRVFMVVRNPATSKVNLKILLATHGSNASRAAFFSVRDEVDQATAVTVVNKRAGGRASVAVATVVLNATGNIAAPGAIWGGFILANNEHTEEVTGLIPPGQAFVIGFQDDNSLATDRYKIAVEFEEVPRFL